MSSRKDRATKGIGRASLAALVAALIGGYVGLTNAVSAEERTYKDCKIIFVRTGTAEGIDAEIYSMNADGSEKKNLTNTPHHAEQGPAWSPDGKKIAFVSIAHPRLPNALKGHLVPLRTLWELARSAQIYVMNADGSEQKKLADNSAYGGRPAWSPDGSKIAFSSYKDGEYGLCVMNADGSGQKHFTDSGFASWSPDSKRIVFASYRDGNMEVYVMNADGSEQVRLTNNPARDDYPAWYPDGDTILFASNRDRNWGIFVMDVGGGEQKRLTKTDCVEERAITYMPFLACSPDGKKIMFMPCIASTDPGKGTLPQIHVMNADGTGRKKLADTGEGASWSPDGRKIVFTSFVRDTRGINQEIYIISPDGTEQRNLTNSTTWESTPQWSPFLPSEN